jgi:hypothetical protein
VGASFDLLFCPITWSLVNKAGNARVQFERCAESSELVAERAWQAYACRSFALRCREK